MAVSRLGAVLLIIGLVAGQMVASVLLDHFGWVGYTGRPISFARLFGIVCMVVGIYFVQK